MRRAGPSSGHGSISPGESLRPTVPAFVYPPHACVPHFIDRPVDAQSKPPRHHCTRNVMKGYRWQLPMGLPRRAARHYEGSIDEQRPLAIAPAGAARDFDEGAAAGVPTLQPPLHRTPVTTDPE
jgi:hypothetical protein